MNRTFSAVLTALVLLASGTVAAAEPPVATSVMLDGSAGEYISAGRDWSHHRDNAVIHATYGDGFLQVGVRDTDSWNGRFYTPAGMSRLTVGRYTFASTAGADSWSGHGRGCNHSYGSFEIMKITYAHGEVTELAMKFAQRCEATDAPVMRGTVSWAASTSAPRVQNPRPAPDKLWSPPAGAVPETGNVVYLQSAPGDYIGAGKTSLFKPSDDQMEVWAGEGSIRVRLLMTPWWDGTFSAPALGGFLRRAYYGGVTRYPFDSPLVGGLDWSGDGRGCNKSRGWFIVDQLQRRGGRISSFTLRFTQWCDSSDAPLRGFIRWKTPTALPKPLFTDTAGRRHELPMQRVGEEGWMRGTADGAFRPDAGVTRGQIATILYRAGGMTPPSDDAPNFSDIADSPHRVAIRKLAERGIVTGFKDGTYRPDARISRGHLALLLHRTFIGYTRSPHSPFYFDVLGQRADVAVRALISKDVLKPVGDGRYRPATYATRQFTAMLLARTNGLTEKLRN